MMEQTSLPDSHNLYGALLDASGKGAFDNKAPLPEGMLMVATIAIVQVEQLEKLNANLEKIEQTLRSNMEVAVIQP